MFGWLSQHTDLLTIFINTGTILIWAGFAQLLYLQMRRQRLPSLLINSAKQKDVKALCLISNMGSESVFIEYIIAELETSRGPITLEVTDYEQSYTDGDENEARQQREQDTPDTQQGPLAARDFMHIGTFERLIKRLAHEGGIAMQDGYPNEDIAFKALTLRVIGIHGPEDLPIGAERRFRLIDRHSHYVLTSASATTRQLSSRRHRNKLRRWIQSTATSGAESSSMSRRLYSKAS